MAAPPTVTDPSLHMSAGSARGGVASLSMAGGFSCGTGAAHRGSSGRGGGGRLAATTGNANTSPNAKVAKNVGRWWVIDIAFLILARFANMAGEMPREK